MKVFGHSSTTEEWDGDEDRMLLNPSQQSIPAGVLRYVNKDNVDRDHR